MKEIKHLLTIEQSKLLTALTLVRHCLPNKPIEPILSYFLISFNADEKKMNITSQDMRAGINIIEEVNVQTNAEVCIDGKTIYEIVSKLNQEDIIIGMDDTNLYINQENHSLSIPIIQQSKNYPELPVPSEEAIGFEIPRNKLALGISATKYAISGDETKQVLTGANLKINHQKWEIASTDGHRLSYLYSEEENIDESIKDLETTISARGLDIIYKTIEQHPFNNMHLFVEKGNIFAAIGNITIYARTLEGEYPQYQSLIPKVFEFEFSVERTALNKLLNVLNIVAEDKSPTITFDFDKDENKANINTSSITGKGKTSIFVKGNLPPFKIAFNSKYLQDAIKVCRTDEVLFKINSSTKPVIIEPVGNITPHLNLLMPVQITDTETEKAPVKEEKPKTNKTTNTNKSRKKQTAKV